MSNDLKPEQFLPMLLLCEISYLVFFVYLFNFTCIGVRVSVPGTGVTDSCEQPYGLWELDLYLLEEQRTVDPFSPALEVCFNEV